MWGAEQSGGWRGRKEGGEKRGVSLSLGIMEARQRANKETLALARMNLKRTCVFVHLLYVTGRRLVLHLERKGIAWWNFGLVLFYFCFLFSHELILALAPFEDRSGKKTG